jgi:hypothetical protein
MGFVFRTVFWLGLALIILPPEARFGQGKDDVDVRDVDLGLELHNAAYSAWSFATQLASTCDTNPELCKAGENLWKATATAAGGLAAEVQDRWQEAPVEPVKLAETKPKHSKKIQARVE